MENYSDHIIEEYCTIKYYITTKYYTVTSNVVLNSNVQCIQYYAYIQYSDFVQSDITHIPDQTPHWTHSPDPTRPSQPPVWEGEDPRILQAVTAPCHWTRAGRSGSRI